MATADGTDATEQAASEEHGGRVSTLLAGSRSLVRLVYRDPENIPERLTLKALERLGEPSRAWAQAALARQPASGPAALADDLRRRSATVARIDGAIAGTPFFIALVPAYLGYLWQEAQMLLRTAALFGHDPCELRTAAELLALRGVHPTVEAAREALDAVRAAPLPDKPPQRRSLRTWLSSARMLLVFGGFLESPANAASSRARGRPVSALMLLLAAGVWVLTWVFPLTFMVAMAWSCESNARKLGRGAKAYWGGEAKTTEAAIRATRFRQDRGHSTREILRSLALFVSIALPVAFIAYADHIRSTTGINWLGALGAVVALSLVITISVVARRK